MRIPHWEIAVGQPGHATPQIRRAAGWPSRNKLAGNDPPLHDAVCFHCQQCAEKYLRALLKEAGSKVPRTHNLVALLPLVVAQYGPLPGFRRGMDFLTRFAVDTRYPGDAARKRQAESALRWAAKARDTCRGLLGL